MVAHYLIGSCTQFYPAYIFPYCILYIYLHHTMSMYIVQQGVQFFDVMIRLKFQISAVGAQT